MSLYEKIKAAQDAKDVEGYLGCLHDGFVFVRHESGIEVTKAEWVPTVTANDGKHLRGVQQATLFV